MTTTHTCTESGHTKSIHDPAANRPHTSHPIRALLHDEDLSSPPVTNPTTPPQPDPGICPEWGGTDPLFGQLIRQYRPHLVIEVGSWLGASAITMAQAAEEADLDTHILCIDTWLGQTPSWTIKRKDPTFYGALHLWRGYPRLYDHFFQNIHRYGVAHRITPFPATSRDAFRTLKYHKINADLIYIDGSHEREDVAEDLENFSRRLNLGGHIFGHDFQMPAVKLSVQAFAQERKMEIDEVQGANGAKFWRLFQ